MISRSSKIFDVIIIVNLLFWGFKLASRIEQFQLLWLPMLLGKANIWKPMKTQELISYKECEAILKDLLKKHDGSIFNTAGDSVLTEFVR